MMCVQVNLASSLAHKFSPSIRLDWHSALHLHMYQLPYLVGIIIHMLVCSRMDEYIPMKNEKWNQAFSLPLPVGNSPSPADTETRCPKLAYNLFAVGLWFAQVTRRRRLPRFCRGRCACRRSPSFQHSSEVNRDGHASNCQCKRHHSTSILQSDACPSRLASGPSASLCFILIGELSFVPRHGATMRRGHHHHHHHRASTLPSNNSC